MPAVQTRGSSARVIVIGVLAGLVVLYLGAIWAGQRALLFPRPSVEGAPARPPDARQVWLDTPAGRVEAWYLPAEGATGPTPVLIYFHGNAELIDYLPGDFDAPRSWGLAVLLVEFPGYGRSAGSPSETSIAATALAAADWAGREPSVDGARVVAYGRSLGGAAATILATKRNAAALVLESTFTSVRAFAHALFVPELMVRDPFDSLSLVSSYTRPVLVFHGSKDEIVPFEHGQRLVRAARLGEFHPLSCGHNDCPRAWTALRTFLIENRVLPN